MNDEMPDALIARFVAAKCSSEEDARVRAWISADPERQAQVESLARVWELGELPFREWDARGAWADLAARRDAERHSVPRAEPERGQEQESEVARRHRAGRSGVRGWPAAAWVWPDRGFAWPGPGWAWPIRVAAMLVLAAGAALLWRAVAIGRPALHPVARTHEYATRPGQRAELRLADGTRVLLNVDSRIRVPADFGAARREVSLEGEAFFDVRHDPEHPFRVSTARGVAEDLGTEFVVTAYPENRGMQVAVVSGVVGLRGKKEATAVRLTRDDLAQLDSAGSTQVRRGIDLTPYVSWTSGSLVFEAVPLGAAVPRLERWYDVDIHLADEALASRRLTATFRDAPISDVLDLLALSFDLRVERHGRIVTLSPKAGVSTR